MKRRQFGAGLFATGFGIAYSLLAEESTARPGGGQTFRSKSDSSSSSSSNSARSPSSFDSPSRSLFDDDDRHEPLFPSEPSSPTIPRSPTPSSPTTTPNPSTPHTQSTPVSRASSPLFTGRLIFGGFVAFVVMGIARNMRWNRKEVDALWSTRVDSDFSSFVNKAPPSSMPFGPQGVSLPATSMTSTSSRSFGRGPVIPRALESIQAKDPHFSMLVFEDFLYALYTEAQIARGKGTLASLQPYLGIVTEKYGNDRQVREVRDVLVGAMRLEGVKVQQGEWLRIEVEVLFEANYTEIDVHGRAQSYMVVEKWFLERDPNVPSRLPEKATNLGCPNCGAPLDKNIAAKCGYCGEVASPGKFDWTVNHTGIRDREPREAMLTGTTEEVGTDWPTIAAPNVQQAFGKLVQKDPTMTWTAFQARVTAIFQAFYQGWNERDLTCVRPYLSDNLMHTQRYWIETYKAQGLRNVCEKPRVAAIHIARVRSDDVLDSITVRVYAACVDYTVNESGNVVGGNRQKERQYSEYWTLIRSAKRRGAPREDPVCPNCGAPNSQINMAGSCGHCNAHITAGEFDWVLSRIEQDEVYKSS